MREKTEKKIEELEIQIKQQIETRKKLVETLARVDRSIYSMNGAMTVLKDLLAE